MVVVEMVVLLVEVAALIVAVVHLLGDAGGAGSRWFISRILYILALYFSTARHLPKLFSRILTFNFVFLLFSPVSLSYSLKLRSLF